MQIILCIRHICVYSGYNWRPEFPFRSQSFLLTFFRLLRRINVISTKAQWMELFLQTLRCFYSKDFGYVLFYFLLTIWLCTLPCLFTCNPTWLARDSKLQPIKSHNFSGRPLSLVLRARETGKLKNMPLVSPMKKFHRPKPRRWLTTSSRVINEKSFSSQKYYSNKKAHWEF